MNAPLTGLRDAVVLVPGFLGFGRVGQFYYFSERISAALRAALREGTGRNVIVVPCCTRPVGSLAARQEWLLSELSRLCEKMPALERIHLVGHSTGGLDAQLLACERPLDPSARRAFEALQPRLASIVAIAAPQHGTTLARAAEALFFAAPARHLRALGPLCRIAIDLLRQGRYEPELPDLLMGVMGQLPESARFVYDVLRHRELIPELAPEAMAALREELGPAHLRLTSFVTVATSRRREGLPPDPFFADLHALTADHAAPVPAATTRALPRLRQSRTLVIGTLPPEPLDERSNDGVVTTALQLVDPDDPDELGGIVVADHADVIGHYDRSPGPLEDRPANVGLFHSGSGFDDAQFFELYGRVAEIIAQAIPLDGTGHLRIA